MKGACAAFALLLPGAAAAQPHALCAMSDRTCTDGSRVRITVEQPMLVDRDAAAVADHVRPCFPAVEASFGSPPARLAVSATQEGAIRSAEPIGLRTALSGAAMAALQDPRCAGLPIPSIHRRIPTAYILRFDACCAEAPLGGPAR